MSYGYGVGDFIAVSKLAWDVYNAYKDAPEDFKNISDEIKSLHIIVDRHKNQFQDKTLTSDEQAQLREILQGCTNVLEDLDKLHIKYMRLGSAQGSTSQAIDRIKWTQENIAELRARLTSNTTLLNTFISSCSHTSPGFETEMLSSMEEMKNLINGLRRKHSVLSLRSVASFAPSVKTKEAMKQLCRDLYKAGITADTIRDRKDQAVAAFQDPNAPPVDNQDVPQTAVMEERQKGKGRSQNLGIDSASFRGLTVPVLRLAAAMGLKPSVQSLLDAASNGSTDVVRQLLEKGGNIEARRSDNGSTPLLIAARCGHTEVVRLLLDKGADIEATRSDYGSTPLDSAADNGHTDVVRMLLEKGANIEATRTDAGETPLHSAAYSGHTDVVRMLLEKGANIEATKSDHGAISLDSAAYNGHTDVVKMPLEKGANIVAMRSDDGSSALYNASWRGHVSVVSLLLEKGANIEATRTNDGGTALHGAAAYLQTEVVRLLLENGANIHATTKQAETVLHVVFYVPPIYNPNIKDPKQLIPTITVLLAHRVNILQKNDSGLTPLDLAEKRGYPEAKQLFLEHIKEHNLTPP